MGVYSGSFIYQYLGGYLFENIGPDALLYIMVGNSICISLAFGAMAMVISMFKSSNKVYDLEKELPKETNPCELVYFEQL